VLPSFPTETARGLFSFLVLNRGRPLHRDVLCGAFWGDRPEPEARKALRNTLWRIRSVIEPESERGRFLKVAGPHVTFSGSGGVWVDAWEFEDCLQAGLTETAGAGEEPEMLRLRRAVSLYRGDLLEGQYDEPCDAHRERLRSAYVAALERLAAYCREREQWQEAISLGERILRSDPVREHVHRWMISCHLAMGNRPSALRQYHVCERALREELGIEPMEETRRLYRRVCEGGVDRGPDGDSAGRNTSPRWAEETGRLAAEVEDTLKELYALTARLEKTHEALSRHIRLPPAKAEPPLRIRGEPTWPDSRLTG